MIPRPGGNAPQPQADEEFATQPAGSPGKMKPGQRSGWGTQSVLRQLLQDRGNLAPLLAPSDAKEP